MCCLSLILSLQPVIYAEVLGFGCLGMCYPPKDYPLSTLIIMPQIKIHRNYCNKVIHSCAMQ